MFYILMKNILTSSLEYILVKVLGLSFEHPLHCYLIGRSQVQTLPTVNNVLAIGTTFGHLFWFIVYLNKPVHLNALYFILMNRQELIDFHKLIANKSNGLLPSDDRDTKRMKRFYNEVLCYRSSTTRGKYDYNLRPNRTMESYESLRIVLSRYTIYHFSIMMFFAPSMVAYILYLICDDRRYLRDYPNCDMELEMQIGRRNDSSFSITMTKHRTITFVADFWENLVLWIETSLVLFIVQLAIVLNHDMLIYWKRLHSRAISIKKSLYEALVNRSMFEEALEMDIIGFRYDKKQAEMVDDSIRQFQLQFMDFFNEIRRVGFIMSDVLSVTISFSLVFYLIYVYFLPSNMQIESSSEHVFSAEKITHLAVVVTTFSLTMILFGKLLELHRKSLRTYRIICSITALNYHSQSNRGFSKIYDFYKENRTCYTIFRMKPFVPTTFLSIAGWSFSCFFIIRSLVFRSASD